MSNKIYVIVCLILLIQPANGQLIKAISWYKYNNCNEQGDSLLIQVKNYNINGTLRDEVKYYDPDFYKTILYDSSNCYIEIVEHYDNKITYEKYFLDELNHIRKSYMVNNDDTIVGIYSYRFNSDSLIESLEIIMQEDDVTISELTHFYYDNNERKSLIRQKRFRERNNKKHLVSEEHFKYDKNGNEAEYIKVDTKSNTEYIQKRIYNHNNDIIEEYYYEDEKLVRKQIFHYINNKLFKIEELNSNSECISTINVFYCYW